MSEIAPRLWKVISPVRLHAIINCCGYPAILPLVAEYGSTLHRSVNTAEFMRVTILTTTVVYIITVHQLLAVSLLMEKIEVVLIPAVPFDSFLLLALIAVFHRTTAVVGSCICCNIAARRMKYSYILFNWNY